MFHMKKHSTYADLLSDVIYCNSRFWSEWSPKHMPLALWSTSRDLSKAQIFIFLQACGPATSTCSTVWSYFENDKSFQRLSTTKKQVLSIKTVRNYINAWHQWNIVYALKHGWKWLFVKSLKTAKQKKTKTKYWIQLQYNISSRFIWPWLIGLHL